MTGDCGTPSRLRAPDPDAPCCWGAAMDGPCTCWVTVLDVEPDPAVQEGPNPVQPFRCGDCAYRRDSPEHADDAPLPYDAAHPFWCHAPRAGSETAGMPIVVGYRHPSGAYRDAPHGDSYQPIQSDDHARTWNADGTPAPLCAGWARTAGVKP